jgi:nucleotide-binding universal stress UspA family protein
MYQQILLAVALQQWEEFTPHALTARDVAVTLAKGAGAKLTVLSVYDYGKIKEPSSLSADMAVRYREDMMQRIDAQMESKMKAFLADVQGMDLAITTVIQAGEPRKTIVDVAQRLSADLLVIGAHSKRSVLDAMLGGTAAYVSRHAPCPVIMGTPRRKSQTPSTL